MLMTNLSTATLVTRNYSDHDQIVFEDFTRQALYILLCEAGLLSLELTKQDRTVSPRDQLCPLPQSMSANAWTTLTLFCFYSLCMNVWLLHTRTPVIAGQKKLLDALELE